ncbi:hypothetical protein D3C76_01800 [compost metagenome]
MKDLTTNQRKEIVEKLEKMLNKFEASVEALIEEGKEIVEITDTYDGDIRQQGNQLELYFVNRLKSFVDGREMFRFYSMKEYLTIEKGEIEAGVYEEAE